MAIERITIDRGVTTEELQTLVDAVCTLEPRSDGEPPPFPTLPHVRVGRITAGERGETGGTDMATFKRLYTEAVSIAQTVWDSASTEAKPDATAARSMIDGLAHAVSQNRTALLALTTLKDYDNYTFTHMVNVSILTMGQARSLGIDGTAAPRVRHGGADARHRQGADAARDPQQAGQADRRRVRRS